MTQDLGQPAPSRPSGPPIFVIGSPRSGTTLLRMMLDSHRHISCGPESHFLDDLRQMADAHAKRFELFGVSRDALDARIRDFYDTIQVDYMRSRGKQRWAEKTPKYTMQLDYVSRLYPDAQYLHIIRDGRDVVASHGDRWGYKSAVVATKKWGVFVEAAQTFGRSGAPGQYLELRYEALVADAEAALRPVFEFLREPWDPAVLTFDQQQHDAANFSEFTASRRAEAKEEAAIYTSRVGAGSKQLDPFLRRLIEARSGKQLRALGYAS